MTIPYEQYFGPAADDDDHRARLQSFRGLNRADQLFAIGVMCYEVLDRLSPMSESFQRALAHEAEEEAAETARRMAELLQAPVDRPMVEAPPPNGKAPAAQQLAELPGEDDETLDDDGEE